MFFFLLGAQNDADDELKRAMKQAQSSLFSQFTAAELFARRTVCREWMYEIGDILKNDVTHLMLFEDRFNIREYESFISMVGFENEELFKFDSSPSHSTLTLLCNDIKHICEDNEAMCWLDNVTKLTYFGGSPGQLNWHACIGALVKVLLKHSQLETLVVHRYGYFKEKNFLENDVDLYSQLKTIHLVQPSFEKMTFFTMPLMFAVPDAYSYVGGHQLEDGVVSKTNLSVEHSSEKTNVYVHHLLSYGDDHFVDYPPENIPHEDYE